MVLPGDLSDELDDLGTRERGPYLLDERVGHRERRGPLSLRELDREAFSVGERLALAVATKIEQVAFGDSHRRAQRRADVQAELAADHRRSFGARKKFGSAVEAT